MPVHFCAEVSSNHARDPERCFAFVDAAAAAGCDSVKFQLFRLDELFAPEILERSERHRARKDWELPVDLLKPIAERCAARGVQFACTPFYLSAVAELEPHVAFYKVASYELLWDDLLRACAATGKPVVLSTGMATIEEIRHAVSVLRAAEASAIRLLHTVSAYPTPPAEANLASIDLIRRATGCPVGWSDHTVSPGVVHRAIHRWGAGFIEFHLDLDAAGAEYAAGHCWLPEQIAPVIAAVRAGEEADGSGLKTAAPSELADRDWRADPGDGLRPLKHVRAAWAA
ncbi:MAG: N-acetylneuraminate synthase family protein [Alphaproteobacteria bacterium]|nr:N-acetylneuraminate synthase family protein [Alphaproteobacteria bacterium]